MSNHPVYASTAGITRHFSSLAMLLAGLTDAGLDHIELGWSPPLAGLEVPKGLAAFSANWLVHNYFPAPDQPFVLNLASQEAVTLRRSREHCLAAIQLSAALGAPFYSVHSGFLAGLESETLGGQLDYTEIWDYEQGYTTFLDSLQLLLSAANTTNLRLLIEPNVVAPFNLVGGRNLLLMLAEPREFTRLLADLPDPRLGVLLDLGHLKVTACTLGFNAVDFVDAVAPALGAFHLHDNNGTADLHLPVTQDSWALQVIRQCRFNSLPVINEAKFSTATAMVEHCNWLKQYLNR